MTGHCPPLTWLGGSLHHAPGLTAPLTDDQVQNVGLQAVLQDVSQGRTQVLQDQVTHVWTHPAVSQLGLGGQNRVKLVKTLPSTSRDSRGERL